MLVETWLAATWITGKMVVTPGRTVVVTYGAPAALMIGSLLGSLLYSAGIAWLASRKRAVR